MMEKIKEELIKYLPEVERFLTSVLLEETKIDIVNQEEIDSDAGFETLEKNDIVLFTHDNKFNVDFTIILDEEWYGLLSSIMLGVEEKSNNEITRDLLKKFSSEMSATLLRQLEEDGIEADPDDFSVFTKVQVKKELRHTRYFKYKMEVEGLADDTVRAELIIGKPETLIGDQADATEEADEISEAEQESQSPDQIAEQDENYWNHKNSGKSPESNSEDTAFKEGLNTESEPERRQESVISARHVEFDEFDDNGLFSGEGKNGHSMDLLKDVEMEVSVELGKIEVPLGKVLQLSKGSVLELEKLAGEPVDVLVNGHRIAHGEVVVIDEHFGVRISNLITTRQRLASLK